MRYVFSVLFVVCFGGVVESGGFRQEDDRMGIVVDTRMQFTVVEAQFTGNISREATGLVIHKVRIPAATEGVVLGLPLTIAFSEGHDFVQGDIVGLHWNDE